MWGEKRYATTILTTDNLTKVSEGFRREGCQSEEEHDCEVVFREICK